MIEINLYIQGGMTLLSNFILLNDYLAVVCVYYIHYGS